MKRLLFITGTRADYGKIKSLILEIKKIKYFKVNIFVTGMHNLALFGKTSDQIIKDNLGIITLFNNQLKTEKNSMDLILSKTILGLNQAIRNICPDLILVHGDRVETLAGAVVGCLNNIKVAHIEGGEITGTVDEILRHSITKLSHIHFTTNLFAKKRLIQLGESKKNIFIIGSPDVDILLSKNLPTIEETKLRYNINFKNYGIFLFHSVTTEIDLLESQLKILINSIIKSKFNYVVLYPNNDIGSELIIKYIKKFFNNSSKFKILSSMRFENYLTLLKYSNFLIGNSSSGVIEAPYYGIPVINLGTRQNKRAKINSIFDIDFNPSKINNLIKRFIEKKKIFKKIYYFGDGKSNLRFKKIITKKSFWRIKSQKTFIEIK